MSRSYLAPERDAGAQREAAALTLLAELLGGGTTSYLTERLQFESQKAVYTAAFYNGESLDDTDFTVLVVPADGVTLPEAEAAMDEAIESFISKPIDTDALARIKMQIRASQIYARDDVGNLANVYGSALASGLTVQDVQDWPDVLGSITPDEIIAAAKSVFNLDHSVTGYLMKEKGDAS